MNTSTEVVRHDTRVARHGWPAAGEFNYSGTGLLDVVMPSGTRWVYGGFDRWGLPIWWLDDGAWLPVRSGDEPGQFIITVPGGASDSS